MSLPAISVCVPTVRPDTLGATINSIRAQSWEDWELIVVGQGDEQTLRREVAAGGDHRVRYVHLTRRGLSLARNTGLRAARGDIVAMLDDDCQARPDWLTVLAACFNAEPEVGLVGGSIIASPPVRIGLSSCQSLVPSEVIYDPGMTPPPAPSGFDWHGANFAMRRTVAMHVGFFDEALGLGAPFMSAEDYDYKLRLEDARVVMWSTPRAIVDHHGRWYGLRPLLRYWYRNAFGEGALAAKRAMLGCPRSRTMFSGRVRDLTRGWLMPPRPQRVPGNTVRLWGFLNGYRTYLNDHRAGTIKA